MVHTDKKRPLTVIIPTKNRPSKLYRLLISLKKQSVLPSRIIVSDNSNNDQTWNMIIEKCCFLSGSLIYYRNHHKGPVYGLNFSIGKSKDKILAFLDDDCIPDNDWLKNIYTSLKDRKKSILMGKNYNGLPKSTVATAYHFLTESEILKGLYRIGTNEFSYYLDSKNFACTKDVFSEIGYFDERFSRLCFLYEFDFSERLDKEGIKINYVPSIKVKHYCRTKIAHYISRCIDLGRSHIVFSVKHVKPSKLCDSEKIIMSKIRDLHRSKNLTYLKKILIGKGIVKTIVLILCITVGKLFIKLGHLLERTLFILKAIQGPGHLPGI